MRYVIIPLEKVTEKMLEECLETSLKTLLVSKENKVILKWIGKKPRCLYGIPDFTRKQILKKLKDWKFPRN